MDRDLSPDWQVVPSETSEREETQGLAASPTLVLVASISGDHTRVQ